MLICTKNSLVCYSVLLDSNLLVDAMDVVGFGDADRAGLTNILAAILHLCNTDFNQEGESAAIKESDSLAFAAKLLQVGRISSRDTSDRFRSIRMLWKASCLGLIPPQEVKKFVDCTTRIKLMIVAMRLPRYQFMIMKIFST